MLEIHFIELPKFGRRIDELTGAFDQWLYFLCSTEDLDADAIPAQVGTPNIRKAIEELRMISQSDIEREEYKARLKFSRDALNREEEYSHRMQEAAESREKLAELIGRIDFCEENLASPPTPGEELLKLSQDELQRLANEQKADLLGDRGGGE